MARNNGPSRAAGPLPILFVGIGPCAEGALAELPQVARGLTVPIRGPFGLVLMDSFGEELFTCDWPWVSDFKVPESPLVRERSEFVGGNDARLLGSLSALVRRLRSVEPSADPASPGRVRMNSYVVTDLSVAGAVPSAVRVMEALRKVDAAHDMTVLGLTGRTAVTSSVADGQWFETWKQLLMQLQDAPFAQRVYLLDGCDADKTWLERPEQLHRLGAEFLTYHGLVCRGLLRQSERARTGAKENLLNVCGSFGCRTIEADLPAAAERIAERLAREDLSDLYRRTVPGGWLESVEEQAQTLVDKMALACEKAQQAKPASSGQHRIRSARSGSVSAEVSEATVRTINHVCSREPLVSLCHFFTCLQPKLGRLLNRQRLWDRATVRHLAAETLRRQDETTYGPMRVWLADPQTRWADRFTPEQDKPPEVVVSRPADMKGYLAGCAVFALGLAGIAAGLVTGGRLLVIGGGLLAIAAPVLAMLPTGWTRHSRNRIRKGQEIAEAIQPALYRKRARWSVLGAAGALVAAGLLALAVSLWPGAWTPVTIVGAGVVMVTAGIGVAFVLACPVESHPDEISREEAPGHVNPPMWRCRVTGLLCLGLAWTIFGLWAAMPATGGVAFWILPFGGLLSTAAGVGLALLPRFGRAYLIDRVPKMPLPISGGIGRPPGGDELSRGISAVMAWIDRLALDPDRCLEQSRVEGPSHHRETLFDFVAADWDRQLAEAFRRELKARSDKSLKMLAQQPLLWTDCIVKELQAPRAKCSDLASLFALQAVRAWIESHSLAELLSFLKVDMARFWRLTARLAAPHWPATRVEPEVSASVIAVGKPLWDVLAPLAQADRAPPLVPLEWDSRAGAMVALRVVQGLGEGWRGFPGLPGQVAEGISANEAGKGPE